MLRIRRILFAAEAVTLAQVARPLALARSLPRELFEVHFACARFDAGIFGDVDLQRWPLWSTPPERVDRAVRRGLPIYSRHVLERYVEEDLRLIDAARPDLIVGDFRWSLSVSGPRAGVPVASIANAYWSPFAEREFPLPEHPIVRVLGVDRAERHFRRALPLAFRCFTRPLDELRVAAGLAPFRSLPELLTWGDATLFADPPGLIRTRPLPATQRFLGPVLWTPEAPEVPSRLGQSRPLVYATVGSSGDARLVPALLEALAQLDVDVLLSTAGRPVPDLPRNAVAMPFVRGDEAARRAALVICSGGASTAYQALAEGTPVLGLPSNLDQSLAMDAIAGAGAGVRVRAGQATVARIGAAAGRALEDGSLRAGARRVQRMMAAVDCGAELLKAIGSLSAAREARS